MVSNHRDNSNIKRDLAASMRLSAGQVRSAIASRFCKQGAAFYNKRAELLAGSVV
jgi:hypothetical protein